MDIENMHIAVKQELDKTSALELPAFEPEEIDFWLNNAIRKFVKSRYSGVNSKGTSFEQTQKRTDDLRTLVESVTLAMGNGHDGTGDGVFPNSWSCDIPADYWFSLSEEANIGVEIPTEIPGVTLTRETRVGITECTLDEYRQKVDDPYSEHILHYTLAKPLRLFIDDRIDIVHDGNYTIEDYYLTYLKVPDTVDNVPEGTTDCNLPEHTHDEVVKLAANMMLENIEQPRYQTHMNEVNTME